MSPGLGFFLSAVLGILSFPPVGGWPLAYIALVPFLSAAVSLPPRWAFRWAYLAGFVFYAGTLYWIGLNSGAPPALTWASATAVVAILATVWGLTAWAVSRAYRRAGFKWAALLFVILYVFFEVFWGTSELGFPWIIWALSQTAFLPAIQMADLTDVYGVSLWVLSLNALLFLLWKRALPGRAAWMVAVVFVVPLLYGAVRLWQCRADEPVAVAAAQANTPVSEKWQMSAEDIAQSYLKISASVRETGTRLLVWPETATPAPIRYRPWIRNILHEFCDSTGVCLLTGATDYENDPQRGMVPYNAAFLFRPGTRELLQSAKVHLVPFGERIPGQKLFPFLHNLHLGQAEWEPASKIVVFPGYDGIPPLGCLICFEVVFPEIAADMVRSGATLLTTITNDGWYGNSSGPYQHLNLARLRAVAVRRSIVRAANTGISALILPTGEIRSSLGYNRAGLIFGTVPIRSEITLAARLPRVWLPLYTILLMAVLAALWLGRPRASGGRKA